MMDIFIAIVEVLDRYRLRDIDVLDSRDSASRHTKFYNAIKSGQVKTEKEAALFLYDTEAATEDVKFRVFKNEFKNRLLNTLYFIDPDHHQFSDFQRAYYSAQREWGAIRMLYARNLSIVASELAERLLPICIKNELTELCVLILEYLRSAHSIYFSDKTKYEHYKNQFWEYKSLWDAEHQIQDAFHEIRIEYVKSTAFRPENSVLAQEKLEHFKPLFDKYKSFMFGFYYYCLYEAVYSLKNDYKGILKVCDEALAFFAQKPFVMKAYIAIFLHQKFIALFTLRRFDECRAVMDQVLPMQEEGNVNWFKTMEKKVLLGFHTEDYAYAYAAWQEAKKQKEFKNLQGQNAEIWKLFEAWLYWAYLIKKPLGLEKGAVPEISKFKLSKFQNEIPTLNGDKKGMSIPVLVAQIALKIADKSRQDGLIENIEAIEKYLYRYVDRNDPENYRSDKYINLLMEIPRAGFVRKEIEKNTVQTLKELSEIPFDLVGSGYKTEIVPYEILWRELLDRFDDKKYAA